ncbi:MAG: F0F1 ATP synthase subunit B [Actinomycetota bacterium]
MLATVLSLLAQAESHVEEEANEAADLYPHWEELVVGALAFAILFFFMWKWVLPRLNTLLEERSRRIQGELEKAEETRRAADAELEQYKAQLAQAREEANRIIEEARKTADQLRRDLAAKAEQDAQGMVARAQEEIRAERDRVFQELARQVGDLSVQLAAKVVGEELDLKRHAKLIDQYIEQVGKLGSANGS